MKYSRTVFYLALNITLIVWITFVGVGSVESSAQAPMDGFPRSGPPMPDAQGEMKKLTKKLKLTSEQAAKVEIILRKRFAIWQAISLLVPGQRHSCLTTG